MNDGQTVAFKVLQPEFSRNEEDMQRFIRGMKTALPLRHPNLITLYKAGKTGVYCWMAMEYVEGESMTQVIQRIGVAGMLDWRYGYRVAVHIARALEYAHGQSIIHRNVTPTNILLRTRRQDGQARRPDAGQGAGRQHGRQHHAAGRTGRRHRLHVAGADAREPATSTAGPTSTASAPRSTP